MRRTVKEGNILGIQWAIILKIYRRLRPYKQRGERMEGKKFVYITYKISERSLFYFPFVDFTGGVSGLDKSIMSVLQALFACKESESTSFFISFKRLLNLSFYIHSRESTTTIYIERERERSRRDSFPFKSWLQRHTAVWLKTICRESRDEEFFFLHVYYVADPHFFNTIVITNPYKINRSCNERDVFFFSNACGMIEMFSMKFSPCHLQHFKNVWQTNPSSCRWQRQRDLNSAVNGITTFISEPGTFALPNKRESMMMRKICFMVLYCIYTTSIFLLTNYYRRGQQVIIHKRQPVRPSPRPSARGKSRWENGATSATSAHLTGSIYLYPHVGNVKEINRWRMLTD